MIYEDTVPNALYTLPLLKSFRKPCEDMFTFHFIKEPLKRRFCNLTRVTQFISGRAGI